MGNFLPSAPIEARCEKKSLSGSFGDFRVEVLLLSVLSKVVFVAAPVVGSEVSLLDSLEFVLLRRRAFSFSFSFCMLLSFIRGSSSLDPSVNPERLLVRLVVLLCRVCGLFPLHDSANSAIPSSW